MSTTVRIIALLMMLTALIVMITTQRMPILCPLAGLCRHGPVGWRLLLNDRRTTQNTHAARRPLRIGTQLLNGEAAMHICTLCVIASAAFDPSETPVPWSVVGTALGWAVAPWSFTRPSARPHSIPRCVPALKLTARGRGRPTHGSWGRSRPATLTDGATRARNRRQNPRTAQARAHPTATKASPGSGKFHEITPPAHPKLGGSSKFPIDQVSAGIPDAETQDYAPILNGRPTCQPPKSSGILATPSSSSKSTSSSSGHCPPRSGRPATPPASMRSESWRKPKREPPRTNRDP